jgi:glycerol-3-phosphate responsive antiterminator
MASRPTQAERIAILETHIQTLQDEMKEIARKNEERHIDMSKKLDDLLGLKNKGVGAFWLASSLTGVGILGFIGAMLDKWKDFIAWMNG